MSERDELIKDLKTLINQTYKIENEYKELKSSYDAMQTILSELIMQLPSAIWLINSSGEVLLKNDLASDELINAAANCGAELLEINNNFYQIKRILRSDETLVMATNITKEKRDERLLAMGQLAASLAHEIRNPIGSLSLLIGALFRKIDTAQKPIALQMKEAIARVERIIESTLLFTKGVRASKAAFCSDELESESEFLFRSYNKSDDVKLVRNEFAKCVLNSDIDLIKIVLQNLIFNAIDACEGEGSVGVVGEVLLGGERANVLKKIAQNKDFELRKIIKNSNIYKKSLKLSTNFIYQEKNLVSEKDSSEFFDENLLEFLEKNSRLYRVSVYDSGAKVANPSELFTPFSTTKLKGHGLGLALCKQIANELGALIAYCDDEKNFNITFLEIV